MKRGERYCPVCRYWDGHEQDCPERPSERGPGSPFERPVTQFALLVVVDAESATAAYDHAAHDYAAAYVTWPWPVIKRPGIYDADAIFKQRPKPSED